MSGNRFADCETVEHVLRSILPIEPPEVWDALEADALARIAELTRPVVDEAARERALNAVHADRWDRALSSRQLTDRIIDALGYTTPGDDDGCTMTPENLADWEQELRALSPASAVELDADDLRLLAEWLTKWSDVALHLGVDIDHRLPIGYGCIRNRDTDGAWVLRIEGGDE